MAKSDAYNSGASRERIGNFYQFASIDVYKMYAEYGRNKTHKCWDHSGTTYAEIDCKKVITAINSGKVKLRKVRSGVDAGQQVICVQDLPEDCYTIKDAAGNIL